MPHEFESLSSQINEAAIYVHRDLGPGFVESIYENAIRIALRRRNISFVSQAEIPVYFEGEIVGNHRLDLIVDSQLVVELKTVKALEDIHFAQIRSYLRATRLHVGLLFNFNAPTLVIKRIVLSRDDPTTE